MSEYENDTDFGLSFGTENIEKLKPELIVGMCLHYFFYCPILFLVTSGKALPPNCSCSCMILVEKVEKGAN